MKVKSSKNTSIAKSFEDLVVSVVYYRISPRRDESAKGKVISAGVYKTIFRFIMWCYMCVSTDYVYTAVFVLSCIILYYKVNSLQYLYSCICTTMAVFVRLFSGFYK